MPNAVKAKLARLAADEPQPKVKIKKGDRVVVISGSYRGETGRVIEVEPRKGWARVEGVKIIKKHERPDRQRNKRGGIVEVEAPIHLSNLKVLDPTTGQPTRIGRKVLGDGSIVRYAKKSGASFPSGRANRAE
jgi:large subunit ribosomal protein L24